MVTAEKIYTAVQNLPAPLLAEVLDFVEFLHTRQPNQPLKQTNKQNAEQQNLLADPAFGIWADRADMQDAEAYMRQLRAPRYPRNNTDADY